MSLCGPLVLTPIFGYLWPDNYDWDRLKDIKKNSDDNTAVSAQMVEHDRVQTELSHVSEETRLVKARNYAIYASIFMTLAYLLLWPIPMYASRYVFSKPFFTGWIVVCFIWAFYGALTTILLPLWQGRTAMKEVFAFLLGKRQAKHVEGVEAMRVDIESETGHFSGKGSEKSTMYRTGEALVGDEK